MTNLRHGDARAGAVKRLHNIWRGMLKRCSAAPGSEAHEKYAGRGISVCPQWRSYECFKAWALSSGYSDTLTIERIDNDGNYEPDNCTWKPMPEQARNRRTTRWIEARGIRASAAEWAERVGVKSATIRARLRLGWTVDEALFRPVLP